MRGVVREIEPAFEGVGFQFGIGGQRISTDPLNRAGAVLCTTIHKFKGLESDVAILVDVREDDLFRGRAFLYVAASRARLVLHVFEAG